MKPRNIVIAPCGNKVQMFLTHWLRYPEEKNFDLCILFYHAEINDPDKYKVADYFFHLKDYKYHMLYRLLTEIKPEWLDDYDYFYFLDDDIEIDTRQINQMFALSHAFCSSISQASLSKDSFCSWPMFKQQPKTFCRYVGQIEVMAPLFHRDALKLCLPSFVGNKSSWGVDSVWSKLLDYPKEKLIVFDTVVMRHTLPVGAGELYHKLGGMPFDEWEAITQKFGAKKHNYREYGRLLLVNGNTNRLNYLMVQGKNALARLHKAWIDYDLGSRVRSQRAKWMNRIGFSKKAK